MTSTALGRTRRGDETVPASSRKGARRSTRMPGAVWALLVPFLVLFAVAYVVPIGYTIVQSFFAEKAAGGLGLGTRQTIFIGGDNYVRVLTSGEFWLGMGRVVLFGMVQVPTMVVFALVLALILDAARRRWARGLQLAYFLPYAVPGVIAALLWAYLYVPQLSPIVQGLQQIGIPVDFLAPGTVLWSMANITTWCWTGYNMIILLAAMQAIPTDQFEAARLDGAGEFRIAWAIKVPSLRSAIALTVLMSIIGTIQLFNEPTILKTISSNIDSRYVPMMMAYDTAFTGGNTGYSSAIAITMSVVAGLFVYVYYRFSNRADRKDRA